MYHPILAQYYNNGNNFPGGAVAEIIVYLFVGFLLFLMGIYLIRGIFNIPTIVRLHKAQVRLLEQMAKNQGVDSKKVDGIISEGIVESQTGW